MKTNKNAQSILLNWQLDNAEKVGVLDSAAWNDLQARIEKYAEECARAAAQRQAA